jgi:hypothetical protein
MQRWQRAVLWTACCTPWTPAQNPNPHAYPRLEFFAGYSAIETNDHSFQFRDLGPVTGLDFDEKGRGFETAAIGNLSRHLGIVADFAAHTSSFEFPIALDRAQPTGASSSQIAEIHPWLLHFLAGPELKARNHTRITPFIHALFGVAHSSATFSTTGPILNLSRTDAETGFAMAFGAGFDLRIVRRAGFRGFLTYSQSYVGSDALPRQRVNGIGWSAGILFH